MLKAFNDAVKHAPPGATDLRERGIRALLVIIDRDYVLTPRRQETGDAGSSPTRDQGGMAGEPYASEGGTS
jgi:hypothetical protein